MLPAFLLALREGVEIALVLGIVLGALRKAQRPDLSRAVWAGAAAAALTAVLAGGVLVKIGIELEGRAEQLFEGTLMLLAAGVLTWMIFWMQRQSRHLKRELEAGVRQATLQRGSKGLFLLAFLAVVREGVELALFLAATALASAPWATLLGALGGLAAAGMLGWALFAAALRLDMRRFFQVTSLLLVLFAAGLVAHGIHEFNEAGLAPAVIEHVWDINHILDEDSTAGELLAALFGYNGNPSLSELLAYLAYLLGIGFALRRATTGLPAARSA
ncbi:MAG: FTR1 family protein [Chloroflexota bacterium]